MSEGSAAYLRDLGAQLDREAEAETLLNDTRAFIRRFCVLPDEHCLTAVTLWVGHAHMVKHFHTTPRLIMSSPEAGSGKTRVLEVIDLMVPQNMLMLSPTPSTIFRKLAKEQITLLIDECDTIFRPRGKDDSNEDLRALLNSGYRRGAKIPRCVGPKHDVVDFDVFAAVALAGLGDLPDTLMSRAVIVRMRRRAPHEPVEGFKTRRAQPQGHVIRDRLAAWALEVGEEAGAAEPDLPPGIVDRPAEVWEPLVAVADLAGARWAQKAREACQSLCKVAQDRRTSLGVRLLSDVRVIFQASGFADALHTQTLVECLTSASVNGKRVLEDDAPWDDLHGKPLGKRGLASMLQKYGVRPVKVMVSGLALQGYRREHLGDAWVRYLPALSPTPASPEYPEYPESQGPCAPQTWGERAPGIPDIPDEAANIPDRRAGESASRRVNGAGIPDIPDIPDVRDTERASDVEVFW
jgi:hypothetical protein